jgi:hypothetical protein
MMREKEPQSPLWNYRVNLDMPVRRDHPLRRLNEVLDLSFDVDRERRRDTLRIPVLARPI